MISIAQVMLRGGWEVSNISSERVLLAALGTRIIQPELYSWLRERPEIYGHETIRVLMVRSIMRSL
jgi:hypothetical protein